MKNLLKTTIYSFLLSCPVLSFGAVAYIPQTLKNCLDNLHIQSRNDLHNLQDLCAVIEENRILMSEETMHKAIEEALSFVKENKDQFKKEQTKAIKSYLKHYLNSLDEKHVLLTPQSECGKTISWPMSFISRSLLNAQDNNSSAALDIISLSNELSASSDSITLCGDMADNNSFKSVQTRKKGDPDIVFNANMMNNSISTTPTIVFGTGVSSPSINAWIMSQSTSTQSPINIEFVIPADLKTKHNVSLELHFLVKKQPSPAGNARIQVNAEYMNQNDTFNILAATPTFTDTNFSPDFMITEPSSTDSLKHIYVSVSLDKNSIKNHDLGFFSMTRVAPNAGTEYNNDIYLVAASFKYTAK